jgi:hypothetical protein
MEGYKVGRQFNILSKGSYLMIVTKLYSIYQNKAQSIPGVTSLKSEEIRPTEILNRNKRISDNLIYNGNLPSQRMIL